MKKIILIILLCGIMFLGLTGCVNSKSEPDTEKESDTIITQITDITLSIKEGTLTNTGATLILSNYSDKNIEYGNPYRIEHKQDGKWYKIDVELNFTLPAFILKPYETKEIELDWEYGYGKLAPGTYRIIKDVDYEYETGKYKKINIATEFTIE